MWINLLISCGSGGYNILYPKAQKKYTKYILDLSQKLIFYNILILNKL